MWKTVSQWVYAVVFIYAYIFDNQQHAVDGPVFDIAAVSAG